MRHLRDPTGRQSAFALLGVMIFTAVGLVLIASVMNWSSSTARNSERQKTFMNGLAIGGSVLEKAVGTMIRDYQRNDEQYLASHLAEYRQLVPNAAENPIFGNFKFTDLTGTENRLSIERTANWQFGQIPSKFSGLYGYWATYKASACALDISAQHTIPVAVEQEIHLASIPIFTFGTFYNLDMEISPAGTYNVTGRTHCNGNIYVEPTGTLTFKDHVTASGKIIRDDSPDDPTRRTVGTIIYQGVSEGGVTALTLPIGTNNTSAALHDILEPPPLGESTNSPLGRYRYYNKAELIIRIQTNSIVATSGAYNGFSVVVPWLQSRGVISTNVSYFDKREYADVEATQIDITKLRNEYTSLTSLLGRPALSIYVIDYRPMPDYTFPAVRLINGQTLPGGGLTVATPHPLYIKGHYNAPSAYLGTTNTTQCAPASVAADAITILSGAWNDGNSGGNLNSRRATATTVNAAILSGIVASGGGRYSGGVENFLRLLEDWNNRQLTYNGSMVVLYESETAVGQWVTSGVFKVPIRAFAWDQNFKTLAKLPPATPYLYSIFRGQLVQIAAPPQMAAQ